MAVDRCVCAQRSFESLLNEAQQRDYDFTALCQSTGAGQHCGKCRVYLRLVRLSRRTSFEPIRDDRLMTNLIQRMELIDAYDL